MKSYRRQAGPLKKGLEGSFDEILGVDRRALLRREDQVVIFVQAGEPHPLF